MLVIHLTQCLQPFQNPGFFKKPNPNLTRNFKTQTQPKTEFENLTQPKKNRVYFGLFFKENFLNHSQLFKKISPKKNIFGLIFYQKFYSNFLCNIGLHGQTMVDH
jgi:hypothetical protein